MKIEVAKFGIAFGIVYALIFFGFGLLAALSGWGAAMTELMGSFYPGFGPSFGGALLGALWGFVVGFVFFAAGAWIYNRLLGGRA